MNQFIHRWATRSTRWPFENMRSAVMEISTCLCIHALIFVCIYILPCLTKDNGCSQGIHKNGKIKNKSEAEKTYKYRLERIISRMFSATQFCVFLQPALRHLDQGMLTAGVSVGTVQEQWGKYGTQAISCSWHRALSNRWSQNGLDRLKELGSVDCRIQDKY